MENSNVCVNAQPGTSDRNSADRPGHPCRGDSAASLTQWPGRTGGLPATNEGFQSRRFGITAWESL